MGLQALTGEAPRSPRIADGLPTEALTEIFIHLHPRIFHRYLPLIRATHVCRHWRNVISSTPSGWAWVNHKRAEPLPLSLRLSEAAPIEVEVLNLESFSHGFVAILLPHCARVATRGYCSQVVNGFVVCLTSACFLSSPSRDSLPTSYPPSPEACQIWRA